MALGTFDRGVLPSRLRSRSATVNDLMVRHSRRAVSLTALLFAATVQAQSGLPPGTWPASRAPAEIREYVSRADLVIVSLHDALRRELTAALAEGGPAFAIKSCHIDVAGVIQRIGRPEGIAAGRTSDRLRNPTNAPAAWAAPLVGANAGRRARDIEGYAVDLGSAVGVLRPIAQQPMCASCHGSAKTLDPAVRKVLAERYPADKALGFEEGEIRGWFWVEVSKRLR
jgi:hypothetical protein